MKGRKGGITKEAREERVNKLSALGRAGKAIQGLITPGVASDTPAVRQKLASKSFKVYVREWFRSKHRTAEGHWTSIC